MNSVDSQLNQPFSSRSFEEKIEIKTLGRPMSNLNSVQTANILSSTFTTNNLGPAGVKLGMRYLAFLACCLGAMIRGPGAE
jgi:hypothetical protein